LRGGHAAQDAQAPYARSGRSGNGAPARQLVDPGKAVVKASSRRLFGAAMALAITAAVAAVSPASTQEKKPNILFILADNLGFGDLGVYGGGELRGAPTPRIDQLASESLRLTQFLVEPGCTPSRAALMTGRYSIRSGLSLVAVAGSPISLPAMEITMAEMLRDAGYATAMFGKWHLGAQPYSLPQNKASTSSTVSRLAIPGTRS
jgi:arylsulfatase